MAPSKKFRREKMTPIVWTLPADLLLNIVARFDIRTFVRCAATCQLLRRDLLSPPFKRRASEAAPCIIAYLCNDIEKPLTLVHPTTPAALSFCDNHLSPFLSLRVAGGLLGEYKPVSSRRGLVVLHRQYNDNNKRPKSDLCVYDPMSGAQTFFSNPPGMITDPDYDPKYVILTTADGIGSSFLLLIFEPYGGNFRIHTGSSCGIWAPIKYGNAFDFPLRSLKKLGEPAILCGGVIHWLAYYGTRILIYDLGTGKTGSLKLPPTKRDVNFDGNQLYLATSSDGKLLKLLAIQGFTMFVWKQHPVSATGDGSWSLDTVIDMEEKIRSMYPNINGGPYERIEFDGSGNRTGDVVLLKVVRWQVQEDTLIVFDLETMKMHRQNRGVSLVEIDLLARLQSTKYQDIFLACSSVSHLAKKSYIVK